MKKLTAYQKRFFNMLVGSLLYTITMLLAVPAAGFIIQEPVFVGFLLLALAFFVCGLLNVNVFITAKGNKFYITVAIINFVANIGLGVLSLLAYSNYSFISIIGYIYALLIATNTVFYLIKKHKARNIVFSIFRFLFSFLFIIVFLVMAEDMGSMILSFVPACIVVASFVHVMILIFSGLRRKTLLQIIKKTYTIEILYGLVTLIIATATMLTFIEDEGTFPNFGDALWYCFAVVTTIGFGDYTVTTVVGRILSVILGIYGIIVVALITSIIVNFYNETSHAKDEVIVEEIEKLEEERKRIEDKNEQ